MYSTIVIFHVASLIAHKNVENFGIVGIIKSQWDTLKTKIYGKLYAFVTASKSGLLIINIFDLAGWKSSVWGKGVGWIVLSGSLFWLCCQWWKVSYMGFDCININPVCINCLSTISRVCWFTSIRAHHQPCSDTILSWIMWRLC